MAETLNFLIVPETGDITAVTYQIIPFNGIGPGPGWPTDGTSGNNFQFPDASAQTNQLYNAALVISIASIPEIPNVPQFLVPPQTLQGPWMPPGWQVQATRSIILPDQTTILTSDPILGALYPGGPLLRYGLYIGDAPYLKFRGRYDFSLAVQEYEAAQQAKIAQAYSGLMGEVVDAFFFVAGLFAPGPAEGFALWSFQNALDSLPE